MTAAVPPLPATVPTGTGPTGLTGPTGAPTPGSPAATRTRTTIAVRVTLLVIAVAVLVAGISALVGILVVRRTLIDTSADALSDRADLIAAQLATDAASTAQALRAISAVLEPQGVVVVRIRPGGAVVGDDRAGVRAVRQSGAATAAGGGGSFSGRAAVGGETWLVQARPLPAGGFALAAPADVGAATRRILEQRLLIAVLAGVLGAVLVGLLAARLVSAPLRRTSAAARSMRLGARDVRVPVSGPREVAEVAVSVNELADALQHSESRQRSFLASVSHELRTPLAGIGGQAQALADGLVPPAEQAQVGRTITAEAARLQRLVTDLLDLARLGADDFRLELASTELGALLREMSAVWHVRCADRGVRWIAAVPAAPVVVVTDPRRLRQVLDGLAENALRLLGPGQPLIVEASAGHGDGGATLEVRDGGPGLLDEDFPVAFEPGVLGERYRGRRPAGAGLGLPLARALVTRLGGTIRAGRAPEGGVAMTIRLPARPPGGAR